jgi:hypothetical protein
VVLESFQQGRLVAPLCYPIACVLYPTHIEPPEKRYLPRYFLVYAVDAVKGTRPLNVYCLTIFITVSTVLQEGNNSFSVKERGIAANDPVKSAAVEII